MAEAAGAGGDRRLSILDGWRATSILLVLGAHLLPLGPKILQLNHVAGAMGMALFFTLSGFLIVRFLAEGMPIGAFAARRLARILPLSWLAMLYLAIASGASADVSWANFLFYSNLPPSRLFEGGEHLWSICVEMQFYALAAALCLLPSRKGLYLVPVLALAVTSWRVYNGAKISIITWERVDEILAGGTLALVYCRWFGEAPVRALSRISLWPLLVLLVAASHPDSGWLQYLRPYAGAALVGVSIANTPALVARLLLSRPMAYVAEISYALYVLHGILAHSWLGSGDTLERYLKRPLLFAATFLLAHLSTFYMEKPISRRARRLSSQPAKPAEAALPRP